MRHTNLARLAVASAVALGAAVGAAVYLSADTITIDGQIVIPVDDIGGDTDGDATVKGGIGIMSAGGHAKQHALSAAQSAASLLPPVQGKKDDSRADGDGNDDGRNVQINDPALDHIVAFDPSMVVTRPFEFSTQSETSAVKDGRHVVVGYNSSAGAKVAFFPGMGLAYTQLLLSGFSVSHDGGETWKSGFVPSESATAPFTFGDPSVAMDRQGNIFYTSLGLTGLIINKSTDHGDTFAKATVVVVDSGSDKEWLAIGPDPATPSRDNLYVTWTSFKPTSSELHLARSIDGGATWSSKTLFAPVDDGKNSAFIQFSSPVVDASSGRLYIPFLHFSDLDADNVRVLVSDDGGVTFKFLVFNIAGALDAFAYPNVTPGRLNDCNGGGVRNTLVAGADQGGGRFGLPRFKQTTRLITQPQAVAEKGRFAFVLNTSTSHIFGDPSAGSVINVVFSRDGGLTWTATRVVDSTSADSQHVHPAISMSDEGNKLTVSYYVQQADERLRTDVATLQVKGKRVDVKDRGHLSSVAFDLTPNNIVLTRTSTTNYDRLIAPCYAIGEYQTLARSRGGDDEDDDGGVIAAWGDLRRSWSSPPTSPAAGTHSQPDVFAAAVGGHDHSTDSRDR